MAPEWQCPDELHRLVEALRRTEPRPSHRWGELLAEVRATRDAVCARTGVQLDP